MKTLSGRLENRKGMLAVLSSLVCVYINRNLIGPGIHGMHPLPEKFATIADCRARCEAHSRPVCTGIVWNCAQDCYLKRGAFELGSAYENCTMSWIRSERARRAALLTRPLLLQAAPDDRCVCENDAVAQGSGVRVPAL